MELTDSLVALLTSAADALSGSDRRMFMAKTVKELGYGGQRLAERVLGWDRKTIRKGMQELASGVPIQDNFHARGRKRAEEHLPSLLNDICAIVDPRSQTDPQFVSSRLYTRLTPAEVRRQLIAQKGYRDEDLPTAETIGHKMNALGFTVRRVAKAIPKKNPRNRRDLRASNHG